MFTNEQNETIEEIAAEFSKIVREWIGTINLEKVITKNKTAEYKNACAIHDYCDANMAMLEAFENQTGMELNLDDPIHQAMVNEAWEIARIKDFYYCER